MVLDIETTDNSNEIIQIAYNIYNLNFILIKECNKLINENINKTDYYNKITLKEIKTFGYNPIIVLKELIRDMEKCKYIIGHNISFDMSRIYKYINKYKMNIIHKPINFCTMSTTKYICGLKNCKGISKNPKLAELYKYCFHIEPDNTKTHSANYDVEITFECFYYLYKKNLFNI